MPGWVFLLGVVLGVLYAAGLIVEGLVLRPSDAVMIASIGIGIGVFWLAAEAADWIQTRRGK